MSVYPVHAEPFETEIAGDVKVNKPPNGVVGIVVLV
jgi:hypothetical protein